MSKLFSLKGESAIITGSTKGIGKAIALEMARNGAQVVVSSRKADACDQVTEEINADAEVVQNQGTATAIPCNIGSKEALEMLVQKTRQVYGKIDHVVCNAAINPYYGPAKGIADEVFDKTMASNIKSNHWLAAMVVDEMSERKHGTITIVSSIGGLRGSTVLGAYAITKAADMQLARNLAAEYGPQGVRVNAIAPGLVRTNFARALWEDPETLKRSTSGAPLRRIGEPEELAGIAVYLASPAGAFTTGQTFVVDGGATIA